MSVHALSIQRIEKLLHFFEKTCSHGACASLSTNVLITYVSSTPSRKIIFKGDHAAHNAKAV